MELLTRPLCPCCMRLLVSHDDAVPICLLWRVGHLSSTPQPMQGMAPAYCWQHVALASGTSWAQQGRTVFGLCCFVDAVTICVTHTC